MITQVQSRCDQSKNQSISLFIKVNPDEPIVVSQQTGKRRKTLVVDLDETLVHSSFAYISDPDFVVKVKVQGIGYTIYVKVRPGAEKFLQEMSKIYEVIIFTASVPEYANPVIDKIDQQNVSSLRLFRANCSKLNGTYVKDLTTLNRDLKDVIIIDNSITSFQLQPNNAIHIKNFFDDPSDTELFDLMPFLQFVVNIQDVRPVRQYLRKFNKHEQFVYMNVQGEKAMFDGKEQDLNLTIDSAKTEESILLKTNNNFSLDDDDYNRDLKGVQSPNQNKIMNFDEENQL
ncbi:hypothetical protein pb186bvf_006753 [Paramecium bursaria]